MDVRLQAQLISPFTLFSVVAIDLYEHFVEKGACACFSRCDDGFQFRESDDLVIADRGIALDDANADLRVRRGGVDGYEVG